MLPVDVCCEFKPFTLKFLDRRVRSKWKAWLGSICLKRESSLKSETALKVKMAGMVGAPTNSSALVLVSTTKVTRRISAWVMASTYCERTASKRSAKISISEHPPLLRTNTCKLLIGPDSAFLGKALRRVSNIATPPLSRASMESTTLNTAERGVVAGMGSVLDFLVPASDSLSDKSQSLLKDPLLTILVKSVILVMGAEDLRRFMFCFPVNTIFTWLSSALY
mmetsp:Transcript_8977/g.13339  ORF Transcript_8977/g.13339 Transcript_8977/m.13339 type:complete len:223 (-) Transcript_8977:885-1553(-)